MLRVGTYYYSAAASDGQVLSDGQNLINKITKLSHCSPQPLVQYVLGISIFCSAFLISYLIYFIGLGHLNILS